jgi:hypothetical protein
MNRLTDPIVAHTLSGAALSPCSDAGGSGDGGEAASDANGADAAHPQAEAPVALDAPADVSLVGLRRSLRWLTASLATFPQHLVDVALSEDPRYAPTPIELCHWMADLQRCADEAASQARLVSHICELLWAQASREQGERYQYLLDHPEVEA